MTFGGRAQTVRKDIEVILELLATQSIGKKRGNQPFGIGFI